MRQIILLLLLAMNLLSQTPSKDPDTIQALLVEVRQLRQDIEAMTVASQRVQIALYALQMQDTALARSAQRLDAARNIRMPSEGNRDRLAADVHNWEDKVSAGKLSDAEAKALQERIPIVKSELERTTLVVQSQQAAEAEAATQFRVDQAKLSELQERIGRLDKVLETMGGAGK